MGKKNQLPFGLQKIFDGKGFEWYHVVIIGLLVAIVSYQYGITEGKSLVPTYCDTHVIQMFNMDFEPKLLKVHPCDKVVWTNMDSGVTHSVMAHEESTLHTDADSGDLEFKDSYTLTFTEKGTFVYTSTANEQIMKAKVEVS